MKKVSKRVIYCIAILSVFVFGLISNLSIENNHSSNSFEEDFEHSISSSSPVNGRSLFINQYANITESFTDVNSGENITFTLYDDWVSQNTTIHYDGVTQKRDIISNGAFDDNSSGWTYKTNCDLSEEYQSDEGHPVEDGCISLDGAKNARLEGDYAYFEQNITLDEELGDDDAFFSCYYNSEWSFDQNASVFMSVIIGSVEINKSINILDVPTGTWFPLSFEYNPVAFGQVLQGLVTIRVGLILDEDSSSDFLKVHFDNFKFEVYTKTNELGIVKALDNQFSQNYTYYNTSYGEGYSFIDTERTPDSDNKVDFTIYSNRSALLDFFIEEITIVSHATMIFNSTVSNTIGSLYTVGENTSWRVEFTVDIPVHYDCWMQVEKPIDWSFYEIYYETIDKTGVCLGKDYGSENLLIPHSVLEEGDWTLDAVSSNYMNNFALEFWNQSTFVETPQLTFGNVFRFNATLNNSISLQNTQINCSIFYPNATLFWNSSSEPSSYAEVFGNFTVGTNMTVGKYNAEIIWVNNLSYLERDKVGFLDLEFNVWHHTNLTIEESYFEEIAGDPLLLKINYNDFDLNASIDFATVTYSSTFGTSGSMIYIGSGEYFVDVDTSSLSLGDYYFSFNASKTYYENQTNTNFVHLKIVAQPLALEVPHYALEGNANSIISCNINTTGAISGTKVYPANVSTDWFNPYNVSDHNNGTYTLDFSTADIPVSGFLESFTIEIYANKTNYGTTSQFINLLVYPLATEAHVNTSLVSVNSNNVINLKVNYTEQSTTEIITDANCSLTWQSSYLITPVADGFNIQLHTTGLAVDYYTALIKLEKEGYEDAFESVTVIIIEQDVNLTIMINSELRSENILIDSFFQQTINITARAYALIDEEFLSGGNFTVLGNNFQRNLTESPSTNFSTSLVLDGANFDSGINTLFLRFEQANYTTKIFPFQLFIRAQNVNLTTEINYQEVHENYLLEKSYNEEFQISCRAFADIEGVFLSGGIITFINGEYEEELLETAANWFNQTILISTSHFNLGPNYVYLRFQQNNYTTTIFAIQIIVNQVQINVETLDFDGIVYGAPGDTITIQINLTETNSTNYIDNATVYYSWTFGVGYFEYVGSGIYEVNIDLPTGRGGNFDFEIVVSNEGILYETEVYSFFISVNRVDNPNLWWILTIIGGVALVAIVLLGVFAYKQKVVIPKQQRAIEQLQKKTQIFDDITKIKSILIIETGTGRLMYQKEFGGMKEDHEDIFSGFLHSILTLSNKFALKKEGLGEKQEYAEFTHESFNVLVASGEKIIVALILDDISSSGLQERAFKFINEFEGIYKSRLVRWNGDRSIFYATTPKLFEEIFHLSLLNRFTLTNASNIALIEKSLIHPGTMSEKVSKIIKTVSAERNDFLLTTLISLIPEEEQLEVKDVILRFIKSKYLVSAV